MITIVQPLFDHGRGMNVAFYDVDNGAPYPTGAEVWQRIEDSFDLSRPVEIYVDKGDPKNTEIVPEILKCMEASTPPEGAEPLIVWVAAHFDGYRDFTESPRFNRACMIAAREIVEFYYGEGDR